MDNAYLLSFLTQKNIPTITRKHHTYLTYYGLEQQYTYVLKEGVIKTSIILKDGREFNLAYLQGPDIISLHGLDVISILEGQNGKCMPQIMHPAIGSTDSRHQLFEMVLQYRRGNIVSLWRSKYKYCLAFLCISPPLPDITHFKALYRLLTILPV